MNNPKDPFASLRQKLADKLAEAVQKAAPAPMETDADSDNDGDAEVTLRVVDLDPKTVEEYHSQLHFAIDVAGPAIARAALNTDTMLPPRLQATLKKGTDGYANSEAFRSGVTFVIAMLCGVAAENWRLLAGVGHAPATDAKLHRATLVTAFHDQWVGLALLSGLENYLAETLALGPENPAMTPVKMLYGFAHETMMPLAEQIVQLDTGAPKGTTKH